MQEFSIQTQAMEILSCVLEDIPKTSDKEVAPAFSSCLGTLGTHKRSKNLNGTTELSRGTWYPASPLCRLF